MLGIEPVRGATVWQNFATHADSSGDQFAGIARSMSNEQSVTATLENATTTALAIVGGCDHAGISLVARRGKRSTVASTDGIVVRADNLQYETGQGPSCRASPSTRPSTPPTSVANHGGPSGHQEPQTS